MLSLRITEKVVLAMIRTSTIIKNIYYIRESNGELKCQDLAREKE